MPHPEGVHSDATTSQTIRKTTIRKTKCQPACKPGSVWRFPSATVIRLGRRLRDASSNQPGWRAWKRVCERVAPSTATPIWSCSRWGLPCRRRCRNRGALLPHRFTLAWWPKPPWRSLLCGTFPWGRPPAAVSRHRASMEPGLSSTGAGGKPPTSAATVRPADVHLLGCTPRQGKPRLAATHGKEKRRPGQRGARTPFQRFERRIRNGRSKPAALQEPRSCGGQIRAGHASREPLYPRSPCSPGALRSSSSCGSSRTTTHCRCWQHCWSHGCDTAWNPGRSPWPPSGLLRPPVINSGRRGSRWRISAGGRQSGQAATPRHLLRPRPRETFPADGDRIPIGTATAQNVVERTAPGIDHDRAGGMTRAEGHDRGSRSGNRRARPAADDRWRLTHRPGARCSALLRPLARAGIVVIVVFPEAEEGLLLLRSGLGTWRLPCSSGTLRLPPGFTRQPLGLGGARPWPTAMPASKATRT